MNPPVSVLDIFLKPGEFYFGEHDTRMRTLLGSCIAITVWHPQFRIGGMCHYLLPENKQAATRDKPDGRYANHALQLFMHEIRSAGTHPCEYVVKMFGGGSQFSVDERLPYQNVPEKNIDIGKDLLAQHGFNLSSQHTGGSGHRKVVFDVWSGNVWMQHSTDT